jgi:hypothetical protein
VCWRRLHSLAESPHLCLAAQRAVLGPVSVSHCHCLPHNGTASACSFCPRATPLRANPGGTPMSGHVPRDRDSPGSLTSQLKCARQRRWHLFSLLQQYRPWNPSTRWLSRCLQWHAPSALSDCTHAMYSHAAQFCTQLATPFDNHTRAPPDGHRSARRLEIRNSISMSQSSYSLPSMGLGMGPWPSHSHSKQPKTVTGLHTLPSLPLFSCLLSVPTR